MFAAAVWRVVDGPTWLGSSKYESITVEFTPWVKSRGCGGPTNSSRRPGPVRDRADSAERTNRPLTDEVVLTLLRVALDVLASADLVARVGIPPIFTAGATGGASGFL